MKCRSGVEPGHLGYCLTDHPLTCQTLKVTGTIRANVQSWQASKSLLDMIRALFRSGANGWGQNPTFWTLLMPWSNTHSLGGLQKAPLDPTGAVLSLGSGCVCKIRRFNYLWNFFYLRGFGNGSLTDKKAPPVLFILCYIPGMIPEELAHVLLKNDERHILASMNEHLLMLLSILACSE